MAFVVSIWFTFFALAESPPTKIEVNIPSEVSLPMWVKVSELTPAATLKTWSQELSLRLSRLGNQLASAEDSKDAIVVVQIPFKAYAKNESPVIARLVNDIRFHARSEEWSFTEDLTLYFDSRGAIKASQSFYAAAVLLQSAPDRELRPILQKGRHIGHGRTFKICEAILDRVLSWLQK